MIWGLSYRRLFRRLRVHIRPIQLYIDQFSLLMPKWHWPIDPDKVPRIVVEPPGPKALEVVRRDEELIMQSFARWYPLVIARGYGPVVEDVDGNLYIDYNAGIAVTNVGHAHPKVVEAIKRQAELFLHYSLTDFYYEAAVKLAEKLVSIAPISGRKKVFFTNSGTESIEGVLKIARGYFKGQRPYVIAFLGAFHGRTYGSMSVTASKPVHRRHFSPLVPNVIHAPYPHPVHCPFKASMPEECGEYALAFIEDWILKRLVDPSEVSLVLIEPIQGEGATLCRLEASSRVLGSSRRNTACSSLWTRSSRASAEPGGGSPLSTSAWSLTS
jgi:4-aminobutyrate aminotransferase